MDEADIALEPERHVLVEHRVRVLERVVAVRRPLPQEGQQRGTPDIVRAIQQLFMPCHEGGVLFESRSASFACLAAETVASGAVQPRT